ncbi:MAG: molybdate ABC transporter substrate-binding protein [Minwuia sp.]|nr:molybdate ABC transporter substrate-binding protein [Minwuia sp.]
MRPVPAILVALVLLLTVQVAAAERLTVFAAASLRDVMTRIGDAYQRQHASPVRFSFAASSTLARQVEAGAPADIIISANTAWMDYLAEATVIESGSRMVLAKNALALVGHRDRFPKPVGLAPALGDLMVGERLAIGDPAHVPAGIYARQALIELKLWSGLQGQLAYAADVRAALALVARGEAALGLTYLTDVAVAADTVTLLAVLPPGLHAPIVYPAAIIAGRRTDETVRFMAFLQGEEAALILRDAGFTEAPRP